MINDRGREPDLYEKIVKEVKRRHKAVYPQDTDYMYPDKLFNFWKNIPFADREASKLNLENDEAARQMFHRYYNARIKELYNNCNKSKGTKTYDYKVVFQHWKDIYPAVEKKDKDLQFESDTNASKMIQNWIELLKKEEADRKVQMIAELRLKEIEAEMKKENQMKSALDKSDGGRYQGRISNVQLGPDGKPLTQKQIQKQETQKASERLARPKERLKRGKTLVELNSKFPKDRILQQYLVDEFQNDKLIKRPLEYDNVDSEEEDNIKLRAAQSSRKSKKIADKNNKRSNSAGGDKKDTPWLTSVQKQYLREQELMTRFAQLSKKYDMDKDIKMKEERDEDNKYNRQKKEFDEFLVQKAKQYRKNVLQKQNEAVPSENTFLSDVSKYLNVDIQRSPIEIP